MGRWDLGAEPYDLARVSLKTRRFLIARLISPNPTPSTENANISANLRPFSTILHPRPRHTTSNTPPPPRSCKFSPRAMLCAPNCAYISRNCAPPRPRRPVFAKVSPVLGAVPDLWWTSHVILTLGILSLSLGSVARTPALVPHPSSEAISPARDSGISVLSLKARTLAKIPAPNVRIGLDWPVPAIRSSLNGRWHGLPATTYAE